MGLSYETEQLAFPEFFSSRNTTLVQYFRTLSPSGVLRLGGGWSAFGRWSESRPVERGGTVDPSDEQTKPKPFEITPEAILNLEGFLEATGWRCIYGLNLESRDVGNALAEAKFVAKTLGPRLICVQFGNEPDLFARQNAELWTYDKYDQEWTAFRAAFRKNLPEVAVAGPDTSNNLEWMKRFTAAHSQDVSLLTSHYYAGGPPSDPAMTPEFLLHPGARFDHDCLDFVRVAQAAGRPYRITECNSCWGGGKLGVSDVFAASLWASDFCLSVARLGVVGVNFHGGGNGRYSPIVGDRASGYRARPEFYGLLLAQNFAGRDLLATRVTAQGENLTSYAGGAHGKPELVALFNKDPRSVDVVVAGLGSTTRAAVIGLRGPDLTSKERVTLGSSEVQNSGAFQPNWGEPLTVRSGAVPLRLGGYSAALLRLS
jgi:hypothetical protein